MPIEWIGYEGQELVLQDVIPSPWHVLYVCITDDQPEEAVTPFHFASLAPCHATSFFRLMFAGYQTLHFFYTRLHLQNELAAKAHRFAYFYLFCQNKNFTPDYFRRLQMYPALLLYIDTVLSDQQVDSIRKYGTTPLVLCTRDETATSFKKAAIPVLLLSDVTSERLQSEIGRMFSNMIADPEHPLYPIVNFAKMRSQLNFGASGLRQTPEHNFLAVQPTEILSNHLNRSLLPDTRTPQPPFTQRAALIVASARQVFRQRIANSIIVSRESEPAARLTDDIERAVDTYLNNRTAEALDTVEQACEHLIAKDPDVCSYILCCPCINREVPLALFGKAVPTRVSKYLFQRKQNDYRIHVYPKDFRNDNDCQLFLTLFQLQGLENEFLTNLLTLFSVTLRQPVIRTPQMASALFGHMHDLSLRYQQGGMKGFVKKLNEVASAMWNQIPEEMQEFIKSSNAASVKLVSDLPLEWLPVDGVPLMYRTPVSRMPITTLNILQGHYQLSTSTIRISPEHLNRILIMNCLSADDPLFHYAESLSRIMRESGESHTYKVVNTVDEYRACLAEHKPVVLIHWGHGSYDKGTDTGFLHIGQSKTKVWDLKPTVVPAIVLLAACETAALAETHNTPANAFLTLGARTVLATYFPVEADLTLMLYGRIMANYKEALLGRQRQPSWHHVVSKTLILNRYLDFVLQFLSWRNRKGQPGIPSEFFLEYTYRWNHANLDSVEQGYKCCTGLIADTLRHFGDELANSFEEFLRVAEIVPHTMFFTQLGSPETILLEKTNAPRPEPELVASYWARREEEERA